MPRGVRRSESIHPPGHESPGLKIDGFCGPLGWPVPSLMFLYGVAHNGEVGDKREQLGTNGNSLVVSTGGSSASLDWE
jgi:hypothetical protein